MSVITFPAALAVMKSSWAQHRNDIQYRSPFGAQVVEGSGPLWAATLQAPLAADSISGAWKAYLMQLRGKTNQAALWDFGRPAPRGTMRGTMTLNAEAVQGATTLSIIASGENAKTLVQGDLLGLGSGITQQVVMVTADATSNGSGVISVTVEPPLRNTHAIAAAVTWDKPCALFRRASSAAKWDYAPSGIAGDFIVSNFSLDLIEDWRA